MTASPSQERVAPLRGTAGLWMAQSQAWLLFLLSFAIYANTLGHQLVWDDHYLDVYVSKIVAAQGLPGLLRSEFRLGDMDQVSRGYYRPVVLLTFHVDRWLSDRFFPSHHLSNVLLFSLTSVLVFKFLEKLMLSPSAAFSGSLLFAVHPLHVENVAFVSGRTDLLATVFMLASGIMFLRGLEKPGHRGLIDQGFGLGFFGLALLSKEASFMLPAALIVGAAVALRIRPDRVAATRWGMYSLMGWAVVSAAILAFRRYGLGLGFGYTDSSRTAFSPLAGGVGAKFLVLAEYIRLMVVPVSQSAYYEWADVSFGILDGLALVLFAGIVIGTWSARADMAGRIGVAWVLLFLVPVLGFVNIKSGVLAERFLHAPLVGYCAMWGALVARLARSPSRAGLMRGAAAALVLLFGALTVERNRVWATDETLFTRMMAETSSNIPRNNLSLVLAKQARAIGARGDYAQADLILGRAASVDPEGWYPWYVRGVLSSEQGRHEEAVRFFEQSLSKASGKPEILDALGLELGKAGRFEDAGSMFREALLVDPAFVPAMKNLVLYHLAVGDRDGAERALARLTAVDAAEASAVRREHGLEASR